MRRMYTVGPLEIVIDNIYLLALLDCCCAEQPGGEKGFKNVPL